jgi:hypothetical protein
MRRLPLFLAWCLSLPAQWRMQELATQLGVVYAIQIHDMNGDSRPDIVAINNTQAMWLENPTWKKHILQDGGLEKDNVAFGMHDIDGDGRLDMALAAGWQPANTKSGGTMQWLRSTQAGLWSVSPFGAEPTMHRIRWADVDGDGRKELIALPLRGRNSAAPGYDQTAVRVLVYRPAPGGDKWETEVADEGFFHIAHNLYTLNMDDTPGEEILIAAREGLYVLARSKDGKWTRSKLGEGEPGEIKTGRVGRVRVAAAVEPLHGSRLVVYEEPAPELNPQGAAPPSDYRAPHGTLWTRTVLSNELREGHGVEWADLDGDGSDELVTGWRGGSGGIVAWQRSADGFWRQHSVLSSTGMAMEDLAIGDLNGDGRPDVVAGGRATQNIRVYWNEIEAPWRKHTVVENAANSLTAVAADFTDDGRPDVIASQRKDTVLYTAPDWKPRVLYRGADAIHAEVMDVDGDGDMDFVGAQYMPGLLFWLERPKRPLVDAWKFHVIDDATKGGVNGIHGLLRSDIDGDGKPDIIANSAQEATPFPHSLAWFRAAQAGKKWERMVFARGDAPGLSHYFGSGDVNGDGRTDIAAAAKVGPKGNWFAWWEQLPAGAWKKHVVSDTEPGATNIAVVDVNKDGRMDLLASRGHGFGLVWYSREANERWQAHSIDESIAGPHSLATGDIDGDGDVDAATCAKDSAVCAWFANDGQGNFTRHTIHARQASYDVRLVDMDKDGDLDLLVAGQESRNVVWFENRLRR